MTHDDFKRKHGEEAWRVLVEPRTQAPFPVALRGRACDLVQADVVVPMLHLLGLQRMEGVQEARDYIEALHKAAEGPDPQAHTHRGGDVDLPPVAVDQVGVAVAGARHYCVGVRFMSGGPGPCECDVHVAAYTGEDAVLSAMSALRARYAMSDPAMVVTGVGPADGPAPKTPIISALPVDIKQS